MAQRLVSILLAAAFPVFAPSAAHPALPPPPVDQAASPAADHESVAVLDLLTGTFISAPLDDAARTLTWRCAPVHIDGLPAAAYFELAPAGRPADPLRQGIIQVYRRQGELRLRVFDFAGEPGLRGALVGLWAAPEVFPNLPLSSLVPTHDLVLVHDGEAFHARTPFPYPAIRDGATEMTAEVTLAPGRIAIAERGYDASGRQIWGSAPGEAVVFTPDDHDSVVTRHPSGLVVIDLVPPDPDLPALAEGGNITVHYTGWLTTGYEFENSRIDGRPPLRTRVPGTGVRGIDEGLLGMAPGTRRRLVIPPELAFGERGSIRGRIPPGATLIYDLEALEVQNESQPLPSSQRPPLRPPPRPPAAD